MNREKQFLSRWHKERSIYEAWGKCVSETVVTNLIPLVTPIPPNQFLKLPVIPRLKDDQKLVEKAFYRKKDYEDPYTSITDKVGVRFVVLLGSDLSKVQNALTNIQEWSFSKDRDYEIEQQESPLTFDYAAIHFVVRPKTDYRYTDITIPSGTPCEVQIKTILQHAYSELTHDTIYKPQIEATPGMQRNAAKAMALLEATNDYFENISRQVETALSAARHMTASLTTVYKNTIGIDPCPTRIEGMLLEAFEPQAHENYLNEIEDLLHRKGFIIDSIKKRAEENNLIFLQPSVLLAYLVASLSPKKAIRLWPLTPIELEPLLNDLGESIN
ncbi:RelA/SpoT family protein [Acetobacter sp. DmW_136]|uniref:GTP pyrophosphokinase n=1 Tax=Acetobacter sp. DmW_136 TaxID=2591091 RepID=UPI00123881F5|nr:RelA/SpoT domain-containing protein [Acetobacter sp. DmW_136]KAA8388525.1 RelA/SpoT family protein [Acetobacter sp. DmW_136]